MFDKIIFITSLLLAFKNFLYNFCYKKFIFAYFNIIVYLRRYFVLRYVGNIRRGEDDYYNAPYDKAVFPPGSVVPDNVSEDSEMYNQPTDNIMNRNINNMTNDRDNNMRFPLNQGEVLKRNNMPENTQNNNMPENIQKNRGMDADTNESYNANMGIAYRYPGNSGCSLSRPISDLLCEYMGKYITAEFMFGADTYVKKSGILKEMGMNYIVLDVNGVWVICDLTDVKFINISSNDLM